MHQPHVLQCVWPIDDETYTRNELIAEATEHLDKLAEQANAVVTGPPLWYITNAKDTPGWHAYAPGSLLIAVMPAEPFGSITDWRKRRQDVDPAAVDRILAGDPPSLVRPSERTAAALAMTRRGMSAAQIAPLLGVKRSAVAQIRTRANRRARATTNA